MNTEGQITIRQWLNLTRAEKNTRIAAFRAADNALQANGDAEQTAGIDWETGTYLRLNRAVNDLWPTVPWWIRDPALPRTRLGALSFAASVAVVVLVAVWIAGR